MIAASATTAIAWVIFLAVAIFWIVYAVANRNSARREIGSEVELAPNRKPYYDDEVLEGSRLERVQLLGLLFLVVSVIGLPVYWIFEPDRQAGAAAQQQATFVGRGARLYDTTANGGFNCAGCHGAAGGGGSAPYTVTDAKTGEVQAVQWLAPAVNTIFYRFDESEVRFILVYGRPFSPMSPWGLDGGGPMNSQQIDTLIEFLKSIQIERIGCAPNETDTRTCASGILPEQEQERIAEEAQASAERLVADGTYETVEAAMGEALFNLPLNSGAYSCARCHTPGWSYGRPGVPGQGAFGWNLTGGSPAAHFPDEQAQIDFIAAGSEYGKRYGIQGQGSGRMPAFGSMLTDEQIASIVEYTRSL